MHLCVVILSCFQKNILKLAKYWEVALHIPGHGQGLGCYIIMHLHTAVTMCQPYHGGSAEVDARTPPPQACSPCALREKERDH